MRTETSDGVEIAWDAHGSVQSSPLVLLHSLGANGGMWHPQVATLQDRYRVIVPDLRGHGASAAPPGPYSIEMLAADVLAVADAEGLESFAVCGISIGGLVSLWLAINRPDRVTSLVASNTGARIGTAEAWEERAETVRHGGLAPLTEQSVVRWFGPDFAKRHPRWLDEFVAAFEATDPDGYAGCCGVLATTDLRQDVGAIASPTLVIGGARDESTPPDMAEWLAEHIPGSRLVVLDAARHLSSLDQDRAFTAAVEEFLSQR